MNLQKKLISAWTCLKNAQYPQAISHAKHLKTIRNDLPELDFIILQASLASDKNNEFLLEYAKETITKYPNHPELLTTYAQIYSDLRRDYRHALMFIEKSIALKPDYHTSWLHKSWLHFCLHEYQDVIISAEKALALKTNQPAALTNLAAALKELGRVEESLAASRRIFEIRPDDRTAWSNYMFTLLFSEKTTGSVLMTEAKKRAKHIKYLETGPLKLRPENLVIKIAILSNDLYKHSCAYFLLPFLANLNRQNFSVDLIYLNVIEDNVTLKLKKLSDNFFYFDQKMSDEEIAKKLREKNYDIAIDLGGFTGRSPIDILALRIAPIQLTWLGYPGTSGSKNLDFRITDRNSDPIGNEKFYTESLIRLEPIFGIYFPRVQAPLEAYSELFRVRNTPALKNGYITFGSTNNIAKISDSILRVWTSILNSCPNSKLLLEGVDVESDTVKNFLMQRMHGCGITDSRLIFRNRDQAKQYLNYHDIDILLDTSPLTGGTTTCDALWMGVPVVTLESEAFHTRMSSSLLRVCGLNDWIAKTTEEYHSIACQFASNVKELNEIRQLLRFTFEEKVIFKAADFTRNFERAIFSLLNKPILLDHKNQRETIYFSGTNHDLNEIKFLFVDLVQKKDTKLLRTLLENLSTKYYKHWLISYGLALISIFENRLTDCKELLMESVRLADSERRQQSLFAVLASINPTKNNLENIVRIAKNYFDINLESIDLQACSRISYVMEIEE